MPNKEVLLGDVNFITYLGGRKTNVLKRFRDLSDAAFEGRTRQISDRKTGKKVQRSDGSLCGYVLKLKKADGSSVYHARPRKAHGGNTYLTSADTADDAAMYCDAYHLDTR